MKISEIIADLVAAICLFASSYGISLLLYGFGF